LNPGTGVLERPTPLETYTKTELLTAQGPFYQADSSWRKKLEEWTLAGIMKTVGEETRSQGPRTAPHHYDAEAAYILAVLFHMRAVGFSNARIRATSFCLHGAWHGYDHDHPPSTAFLEYWQAAKHGGERSIMERHGLSDPDEQTKAPDTPCELTIGLIPDDGCGFNKDELSVFVMYGSGSEEPNLPEFRINLTELFRQVKLPERKPPIETPAPPVGRAALPPILRHPISAAAFPARPAAAAEHKKRRA
jgi:hypothetical protein